MIQNLQHRRNDLTSRDGLSEGECHRDEKGQGQNPGTGRKWYHLETGKDQSGRGGGCSRGHREPGEAQGRKEGLPSPSFRTPSHCKVR